MTWSNLSRARKSQRCLYWVLHHSHWYRHWMYHYSVWCTQDNMQACCLSWLEGIFRARVDGRIVATSWGTSKLAKVSLQSPQKGVKAQRPRKVKHWRKIPCGQSVQHRLLTLASWCGDLAACQTQLRHQDRDFWKKSLRRRLRWRSLLIKNYWRRLDSQSKFARQDLSHQTWWDPKKSFSTLSALTIMHRWLFWHQARQESTFDEALSYLGPRQKSVHLVGCSFDLIRAI